MKAVYPGTFDPFTLGHLDVVKRGLKLFDSLVIAVAENESKNPLFSADERVEMIRGSVNGLKGVEVKHFGTLLIDFVKKEKSSVILRGLRETSDFSAEFQHSIVNRVMDPAIETVFVMTNPEYFYVTSSLVKEIAAYGGNTAMFVPDPVQQKLRKKFR
ncbi:MAG: pantetheine-phosphate adenylyltransferase [archaeon]